MRLPWKSAEEFTVPKTKRFLFYKIKDEITRLDNTPPMSHDGAITLYGARKTGKTFMLYQLLSEIPNSVYLDFRKIKDRELVELFHSEVLAMVKQGMRHFFLDEVSFLNDQERGTIISSIMSFCSESVFILSGSVARLVQSMSSELCRGREFQLCPLMYTEAQLWLNPMIDWKGNPYLNLVTETEGNNARLQPYLYGYQDLAVEIENKSSEIILARPAAKTLEYVKNVLNETILAYSRLDLGNGERFERFQQKASMEQWMAYIGLCQFVYKKGPSQQKFIDIPKGKLIKILDGVDLSKNVKDSLTAYFQTVGKISEFGNKTIETFLSFLESSALVYRAQWFPERNAKKGLDRFHSFAYPWHTLILFDKFLAEEHRPAIRTAVFNLMVDTWLEGLITNLLWLVTEVVGKYRDEENNEIDVVWETLMGKSFGVEIKNRSMTNISAKTLVRMREVLPDAFLVVTTKDDKVIENYVYKGLRIKAIPNELLIRYLETEYIVTNLKDTRPNFKEALLSQQVIKIS